MVSHPYKQWVIGSLVFVGGHMVLLMGARMYSQRLATSLEFTKELEPFLWVLDVSMAMVVFVACMLWVNVCVLFCMFRRAPTLNAKTNLLKLGGHCFLLASIFVAGFWFFTKKEVDYAHQEFFKQNVVTIVPHLRQMQFEDPQDAQKLEAMAQRLSRELVARKAQYFFRSMEAKSLLETIQVMTTFRQINHAQFVEFQRQFAERKKYHTLLKFLQTHRNTEREGKIMEGQANWIPRSTPEIIKSLMEQ